MQRKTNVIPEECLAFYEDLELSVDQETLKIRLRFAHENKAICFGLYSQIYDPENFTSKEAMGRLFSMLKEKKKILFYNLELRKYAKPEDESYWNEARKEADELVQLFSYMLMQFKGTEYQFAIQCGYACVLLWQANCYYLKSCSSHDWTNFRKCAEGIFKRKEFTKPIMSHYPQSVKDQFALFIEQAKLSRGNLERAEPLSKRDKEASAPRPASPCRPTSELISDKKSRFKKHENQDKPIEKKDESREQNEDRLSQQAEKLKRQGDEMARLHHVESQQKAVIKELEKKNRAQKERIGQLEQNKRKKAAEITQLWRENATQDKEILAIRKDLFHQEQKNKEQEKKLGQQAKVITQQDQLLQGLHKEIEVRKVEQEKQAEAIKKLEQQLKERLDQKPISTPEESNHLKQLAKENEQLKGELNATKENLKEFRNDLSGRDQIINHVTQELWEHSMASQWNYVQAEQQYWMATRFLYERQNIECAQFQTQQEKQELQLALVSHHEALAGLQQAVRHLQDENQSLSQKLSLQTESNPLHTKAPGFFSGRGKRRHRRAPVTAEGASIQRSPLRK